MGHYNNARQSMAADRTGRIFCHKMTLRHLLTAFSLLHHFGELINGSPLKPPYESQALG